MFCALQQTLQGLGEDVMSWPSGCRAAAKLLTGSNHLKGAHLDLQLCPVLQQNDAFLQQVPFVYVIWHAAFHTAGLQLLHCLHGHGIPVAVQ